jgi:hypothetical protein
MNDLLQNVLYFVVMIAVPATPMFLILLALKQQPKARLQFSIADYFFAMLSLTPCYFALRNLDADPFGAASLVAAFTCQVLGMACGCVYGSIKGERASGLAILICSLLGFALERGARYIAIIIMMLLFPSLFVHC